MSEWWKSFFDADYVRLWGAGVMVRAIRQHAEAVWELLGLREGSRLLDAPCGYGRVSEPMARRGAVVVGVDQSAEMLAQAERDRGDLPVERLRYVRHDLREPLAEGGFDAAMNLFLPDGMYVTPLPATLPLFASGLGALGLLGWRRKRKAQAAA